MPDKREQVFNLLVQNNIISESKKDALYSASPDKLNKIFDLAAEKKLFSQEKRSSFLSAFTDTPSTPQPETQVQKKKDVQDVSGVHSQSSSQEVSPSKSKSTEWGRLIPTQEQISNIKDDKPQQKSWGGLKKVDYPQADFEKVAKEEKSTFEKVQKEIVPVYNSVADRIMSLSSGNEQDQLVKTAALKANGYLKPVDADPIIDAAYTEGLKQKVLELPKEKREDYELYNMSAGLMSSTDRIIKVVQDNKGFGSGFIQGLEDYVNSYGTFTEEISRYARGDSDNAIKKLQSKVQAYNTYVKSQTSIDKFFEDSTPDLVKLDQNELRFLDLSNNKEFVKSLSVLDFDNLTEDQQFFIDNNTDEFISLINDKVDSRVSHAPTFTQAEKDFLEMAKYSSEIIDTYKDKVNISYDVGSSIAQSLAFLGEMALTGGVFSGVSKASVSGVSKLGVNAIKNKVAKAIVDKGIKLTGAAAGAAVTTPLMPSFYTGIGEGLKNGESLSTATFKSYARTFKESFIEKGLFAGEAGASTFDNFLFASGSAMAGVRTVKDGILAIGKEVLEEEVSQGLDYIIDGKSWKEMVQGMTDARGQGVLLLSTVGMQGAFGGLKVAQSGYNYGTMLRMANAADSKEFWTEAEFKAVSTQINNPIAKARLERYGKRVDKNIKDEIDASLEGDDINISESMQTARGTIMDILTEKAEHGELSEAEIEVKAKDALNYYRWKVRDVAFELSKKKYGAKLNEAQQAIEKDDEAPVIEEGTTEQQEVQDPIEEQTQPEETIDEQPAPEAMDDGVNEGVSEVGNEGVTTDEVIEDEIKDNERFDDDGSSSEKERKSTLNAISEIPKSKNELTNRLSQQKAKELSVKYWDELNNELEKETKKLLAAEKKKKGTIIYKGKKYKITPYKNISIKNEDGTVRAERGREVYAVKYNKETKKEEFVKVPDSEAKKIKEFNFSKRGGIYRVRSGIRQELIQKYKTKIQEEVSEYIKEREQNPLKQDEKMFGLTYQDLRDVDDIQVRTKNIKQTLIEFSSTEKGKKLNEEGKLEQATEVLSDFLTDDYKNQKAKHKEKLPTEANPEVVITTKMKQLKQSYKDFSSGAKKGLKIANDARKGITNTINELYKELGYTAKTIPTSKARQINNLVRGLNSKNYDTQVDKIQRVFEIMTDRAKIDNVSKKAHKLRKTVQADISGRLGSLYNAVRDFSGLGNIKFKADDVYIHMGAEALAQYEGYLDKFIGADLKKGVTDINFKEFQSFVDKVKDVMRSETKSRSADIGFKNDLAREIDEKYDTAITDEGVNELAQEVSNEIGVDIDIAKQAIRKARGASLQREISNVLSGKFSSLSEFNSRIDALAKSIAEVYGISEKQARTAIENNSKVRAVRNSGEAYLGAAVSDEIIHQRAQEINSALDVINDPDFMLNNTEQIPFIEDFLVKLGDAGVLDVNSLGDALNGLNEASVNNVIDVLVALSEGNINKSAKRALIDIKANKLFRESLESGTNFLRLDKTRAQEQSKITSDKDLKSIKGILKSPIKYIGEHITKGVDFLMQDRAVRKYKGRGFSSLIDRLIRFHREESISIKGKQAAAFWQSRNANSMVGTIFNPFSEKGALDFFNKIYKPLSNGITNYEMAFNSISESISELYDKALQDIKSIDGVNKEFQLEVLVALHNLQLEIDSNPDIYGLTDKITVQDFIDKLKEEVKKPQTKFTEHSVDDVEVIQKIYDSVKAKDGGVDMDLINSNKSFAYLVNEIQDVNNNILLPAISSVSMLDTEQGFIPIKNRMHRKAVSSSLPTGEDIMNDIMSNILMSSRFGIMGDVGSAMQRRTKVPAISFLGVNAFMSDVNDVMYNKNAVSEMRDLLDVFDKLQRDVEDRYVLNHLSEEERTQLESKKAGSIFTEATLLELIKAKKEEFKGKPDNGTISDLEFAYDNMVRGRILQEIFKNSIENEYATSLVKLHGLESYFLRVVDNFKGTVLGRIGRTGAEFASNLPIVFSNMLGKNHKNLLMGSKDLTPVMSHIKSPVLTRMGRLDYNDFGVRTNMSLNKARVSNRSVSEKFNDITAKNVLRDTKKRIETSLIKFSDQQTGRYTWNITFYKFFKKGTGVDFDIDKFNTDKEYKKKYDKAIKEAGAIADNLLERGFGASSRVDAMADVAYAKLGKRDKNGRLQPKNAVLASMQNMFRSFVANDAMQTREALRKLLDVRYSRNDGNTVKIDAAKLIAGIYARQIVYMKAITAVSSTAVAFATAASRATLDKDEERNFFEELVQDEVWSSLKHKLARDYTTPEMSKELLFTSFMIPIGFFRTAPKILLSAGLDAAEDKFYRDIINRPYTKDTDDVYAAMDFGAAQPFASGAKDFFANLILGLGNNGLRAADNLASSLGDIVSYSESGINVNTDGALLRGIGGAASVWDGIAGFPMTQVLSKAYVTQRELSIDGKIDTYIRDAVSRGVSPSDALDMVAKELESDGYVLPTNLDGLKLKDFIDTFSKIDKVDIGKKYIDRIKAVDDINKAFSIYHRGIETLIKEEKLKVINKNRYNSLLDEKTFNELETKAKDKSITDRELLDLAGTYSVIHDYEDGKPNIDAYDELDLWTEYFDSKKIELRTDNIELFRQVSDMVVNDADFKARMFIDRYKGVLSNEQIETGVQVIFNKQIEFINTLALSTDVDIPYSINLTGEVQKSGLNTNMFPIDLDLMNERLSEERAKYKQ